MSRCSLDRRDECRAAVLYEVGFVGLAGVVVGSPARRVERALGEVIN